MIKNPVDLSFMRVKVRKNIFDDWQQSHRLSIFFQIKKYKKLEDFDADVQQMVDNCQLFYKTTDINKVDPLLLSPQYGCDV